MSTYHSCISIISPDMIPIYMKSILGLTSTLPQAEGQTKAPSLLKLLEEYAKKHGLQLSDLYNPNGISIESLQKLGKIERGDSIYGGPEIEVPQALLVGTNEEEGDQTVSVDDSQSSYGKNRSQFSLQKKKPINEIVVNNKAIKKIMVVIPPSVMGIIDPELDVNKMNPINGGRGSYFTIGVIEDRSKPLEKNQLRPGQYDPNNPVYQQMVSFASHSDHKNPAIGKVLKRGHKLAQDVFREKWTKEFRGIINEVSGKNQKIKEFIIKGSEAPDSKIKITSISEPLFFEGKKTADNNCDFSFRVQFKCKFKIRDEFLDSLKNKVVQEQAEAAERRKQKKEEKPSEVKPAVAPSTKPAPFGTNKPAPFGAPKPKPVEQPQDYEEKKKKIGPTVIRNY